MPVTNSLKLGFLLCFSVGIGQVKSDDMNTHFVFKALFESINVVSEAPVVASGKIYTFDAIGYAITFRSLVMNFSQPLATNHCPTGQFIRITDAKYPNVPLVHACGNAPFEGTSYTDRLKMEYWTTSKDVSFNVQFTAIPCGLADLPCPSNILVCAKGDQMCDGKPDCPNGEDEICPNPMECGDRDLHQEETSSRNNNLPIAEPKIVNGHEAIPHSWPWQALIKITHNSWLQIYGTCGGTFIGLQWVLTAGHCVTYEGTDQTYASSMLSVFLGAHHDLYRKKDGENGEKVDVTDIYLHPHYKYRYNRWINHTNFDFALIKLARPFYFRAGISTICLPLLPEPEDGSSCKATGWGKTTYTETGETSIELRETELTLLSSQSCSNDYSLHNGITPEMICAGGGDHDTRGGDSGGPLVCPIVDLTNASFPQRYWSLIGVTSFGNPGARRPGVYGHVRRALPFIAQVLNSNRYAGWYSFEHTHFPLHTPAPPTSEDTTSPSPATEAETYPTDEVTLPLTAETFPDIPSEENMDSTTDVDDSSVSVASTTSISAHVTADVFFLALTFLSFLAVFL